MVFLRLDAPRVLILCGACFMTAIWGALPSYSRTFPSPSRQEVVVDSLFNAGAYDSVLVLTSSLMEKARASADSVLLGRMLTLRGWTEVITRKSASGIESIDASIHISIAARDTTNWMAALGFKGFAVAWQGRYDECDELNRTRLELAQLSKDRASEAYARTSLGYIFLQRGELAAARAEYTTAADLFQAVGQQRAALTPLVGLGRVLNVLQESDAARDCYLRVLTVAREVGDRAQEAHAVNNLGTLEFEYGDVSMAVQYFERAYQLNYAAGDIQGTITPSVNVALARVYLGQYSEAVDILTSALRLCEESGSNLWLGSVLVKLAEDRHNLGRGVGNTVDNN